MGHQQWRYKWSGTEVISEIFDSDEPRGEGWMDSPAKCKPEGKDGPPMVASEGQPCSLEDALSRNNGKRKRKK